MFNLSEHHCEINNVNPRAEKHGPDETVLACDIDVVCVNASSMLNEFSKDLRPMLFRAAGPGEQTEMPLEGSDDLTERRMPNLGALSWSGKYPGYDLKLHEGLGLSDPITLDGAEISKFKFHALDGGSVETHFRITVHPTGEQCGRLCELIQDEAILTLTPPKQGITHDDPQADMLGNDDGEGDDADGEGSEAEAGAEAVPA